MAANISDVARLAGVSTSTVSYALSGKRAISSETRQRIDQAIIELGYTVNAGARALATSQTRVIGVLTQFHEDEFAPAMLAYLLPIADSAREAGYDMLLVTESDGVRALERVTRSGMVDGVVLLDVTHSDPRVETLRQSDIPGVLVGLPGDAQGLDVFDLDFGESARLLIDHLYGLGHREIILVSPPEHVFQRGGSYAWRFRDAAIERAARYGLLVHSYYGEARQPAISTAMSAILDARPTATALVVHNDATVAALPSFLAHRGVIVPDDLSVVSLFSQDFGRTFTLPYTAVESSPDELGQRAVQQLVRRISSPDAAGTPLTRFVAPQLTVRHSAR